jgi:hypothetical protein
VLYARDYAVIAQDRKTFEAQLSYVIKADPQRLPAAAVDNQRAKQEAVELLQKAGDLFE